MTTPLELQRPRLLTEVVGERLRSAIVQGDLKLGEQVSEAQLALRMGVSKTPVREALMRLKNEGLVEIHPQRGTFVFKPTATEVAHLCRFRALIETEALREAMATARTGLLEALRLRVREMEVAEPARDLAALARIDMAFHGNLLESCANGYLRASYGLVRWQLMALRHRSPISNAVASHQVLVEAIGDGDVHAATAMLHEHILENEARYCAACEIA